MSYLYIGVDFFILINKEYSNIGNIIDLMEKGGQNP